VVEGGGIEDKYSIKVMMVRTILDDKKGTYLDCKPLEEQKMKWLASTTQSIERTYLL